MTAERQDVPILEKKAQREAVGWQPHSTLRGNLHPPGARLLAQGGEGVGEQPAFLN